MKQLIKIPNTYNPRAASLIIRIGLAVVFAYVAIDSFREPAAWISFIPAFSAKYVDPKLALDVLSVFQLVLAAVLIWGKYLRYVALLTAAMLIGIVLTDLSTFLITFRDIGLAAAALALVFLDKPSK